MDVIVNVQEAKTRLSELLHRAEAGEEIVIARSGTAVARLQLVTPRARTFEEPLLPGLPQIDATPVLEPMDAEELGEWEDGHPEDPLRVVLA